MDHVHVKEVLSLLDRVHLFAIQNEGNGSLQHGTENVMNMVKGITIRSKKQTSMLFFSIVKCFYNMFMLYWFQVLKVFLF